MNRKINFIFGILFLFSLLSIGFVSSQPPFQSGSFTDGLQLEVPVIEYIPAGQNYTFHVHIYNGTRGVPISNDNLNCSIHIYSDNLGGEHVIQDFMNASDINPIDMYYNLSGEFLSIGVYATVISCISGTQGGFFEYGFDVTPTGEDLETKDLLSRGLLLLFFGALIFFIYSSSNNVNFEKWYKKIKLNYENRNYVKLGLGAIGYQLMKNRWIIFYMIGFFLMTLVMDITYIFNITSLFDTMKILTFIYTWGFVLVGLVFLSYLQEFFKMLLEQLEESNWGGKGDK